MTFRPPFDVVAVFMERSCIKFAIQDAHCTFLHFKIAFFVYGLIEMSW